MKRFLRIAFSSSLICISSMNCSKQFSQERRSRCNRRWKLSGLDCIEVRIWIPRSTGMHTWNRARHAVMTRTLLIRKKEDCYCYWNAAQGHLLACNSFLWGNAISGLCKDRNATIDDQKTYLTNDSVLSKNKWQCILRNHTDRAAENSPLQSRGDK